MKAPRRWIAAIAILWTAAAVAAGPAHEPVKAQISPDDLKQMTIEYFPEAGFDLGDGYDPVSFQVGGKCVDSSNVDDPVYQAQMVDSTFKQVDSNEDLFNKMGIDVSANLKYGIFEGSTTVKLANETKVNKSRAVLLAHILVKDAKPYQIKNPVLTEDALALLRTSLDRFRARCGDYYVHGWTRGGEYIATASVDTKSQDDKAKVEGTLTAGFKSIANEGKVSTTVLNEMNKVLQGRDVNIHEFKRGGAGLMSGITMEQVAMNYSTFVSSMSSSPYPVRVILRPYHLTANWPLDAQYNPRVVSQALKKLDQMAKDYSAYADVLNEIDYQRNPNNWPEFKGDLSSPATQQKLAQWKNEISNDDPKGLMQVILSAVDTCANDPRQCQPPVLQTAARTYKNQLPARWKSMCDPVTVTALNVPLAGDPTLTAGSGDYGDNVFQNPTIDATIGLTSINSGHDLAIDNSSYYAVTGPAGTQFKLTFDKLPGGAIRLASSPDGCKFDTLGTTVPKSINVGAQQNWTLNEYPNPKSGGVVKSISCYWRQYYAKCNAVSLNSFTAALSHDE